MSKLNKKGFALVETLVVSVFVATIFTIMYTNFFPMMGEYERREGYDDVDSVYKTYLIKMMLESVQYRSDALGNIDTMKSAVNSSSYKYRKIFSANYNSNSNIEGSIIMKNNEVRSSCKNLVGNDTTISYNYCVSLFTEIKATNVYLTTYTITDLKKAVKSGSIDTSDIDSYTQDYIDTLAYYKNKNADYKYRIIVEYVKEVNKESEQGKKITYNFFKYYI